MTTTASVDLSDLALWRKGFPDELFAELRREKPLFHHALTPGVAKTVGRDFWMTTKHRHAQRIHRDTDSFTAVDGPLIQGVGPVGSFPSIINMDPPDLTKRRRVITHAFTPRAVGKLEEGIRRRAAALIDRLLAAGGGDWVGDVADVLPMTVIGDIIGIPEDDRPEIFDTLDRILKVNSESAGQEQRRSRGPSGADLFGRVFSYALELTAEKRRNPADDIWSTLTGAVVTEENGEQLSIPANELEIFFFVLAFAGSDTTKNALAAGLQAFVGNPDEIDRYRADETIRASAVEEVLRWSTPVTYWTRTTKVDVEIDGHPIPKGDRVVAMLRSANHDEE
ncbi:MAG: cytochrome P450, partial [Mycobacteriaceae bacterium]|nr:cytochrome P450 [Mycobacteriaceae bacterium]